MHTLAAQQSRGGILHLLKPTDCRDMNAKIGDVGLSRLISGTHLTTASEAGPRFTFNWASPEQIQCKPLTCASDTFSFGVRPATDQLGQLGGAVSAVPNMCAMSISATARGVWVLRVVSTLRILCWAGKACTFTRM